MRHRPNSVVSVCSAKDINVWKVAAQYITKYIDATDYYVFVPDSDVDLFKLHSPSHYKVIGEQSLCGEIIDDLRSRFTEPNAPRFGWYLQQFVKLSALIYLREQDLVVVWDADTVPLRRISFISENEKVVHYKGTERHEPYFNSIEKLLGMRPIVDYSFITQSLAIKGTWIKAFVEHIEKKHEKIWYEAVLDSIDFRQVSGFSEYEMLGTFISHLFSSEIQSTKLKWCRFGNEKIGSIKNISTPTSRKKLAEFEYVAFETWDTRRSPLYRILRALKRRLQKPIDTYRLGVRKLRLK